MPTPPGFQKAWLKIENGSKIEAWFNPKEITDARQNKWEVKPVPGAGLPPAQFTGSQPHKINVELLFDDSDADASRGSVAKICSDLLQMMEVDPQFGSGGKNNARPPMVEFGWGPVIWPKAVCDSVSIQYTLFESNGNPIRAIAKLGLTQVAKATTKPSGPAKRTNPPATNPTTISIGGVRSYTVRDGDSVQSIAYAAYGDPTRWRLIADANGIDDPIHLRRGQILAIPRLVE